MYREELGGKASKPEACEGWFPNVRTPRLTRKLLGSKISLPSFQKVPSTPTIVDGNEDDVAAALEVENEYTLSPCVRRKKVLSTKRAKNHISAARAKKYGKNVVVRKAISLKSILNKPILKPVFKSSPIIRRRTKHSPAASLKNSPLRSSTYKVFSSNPQPTIYHIPAGDGQISPFLLLPDLRHHNFIYIPPGEVHVAQHLFEMWREVTSDTPPKQIRADPTGWYLEFGKWENSAEGVKNEERAENCFMEILSAGFEGEDIGVELWLNGKMVEKKDNVRGCLFEE